MTVYEFLDRVERFYISQRKPIEPHGTPFAKDRFGQRCEPDGGDAVRWCVMGSSCKLREELPVSPSVADLADTLIYASFNRREIMALPNTPERGLAIIRRAKDLARSA